MEILNPIKEEKINRYSLKKEKTEISRTKISSSKDLAKFARLFYKEDLEIYESFFILLLDNSNNTVGYAKIGQGGITSTVVDIKILLRYVVGCVTESLATHVILIHNHPSGKLQPSQADRQITNKIKEALSYLDSKVLDHIIVTKDGYYSFSDNSLI